MSDTRKKLLLEAINTINDLNGCGDNCWLVLAPDEKIVMVTSNSGKIKEVTK